MNDEAEAKVHIWHIYEVEELGNMKRIDWLVDKLLPEKALGQIYGPPKGHKTFVTLDMALCIATGTPWAGRPIRRGRVLYIIGEGQSDMFDRVTAWCEVNGFTAADLRGWFRVIISPVPVNDEEKLIEFGRLLKADGGKFDLIVFDTVNRNMSGNENDTETMKAFVDGCDKLKAYFECSVLVVHHTGHDKTRARGSSVLIAAVDVSVRVARVKETEPLTRVSIEHIRSAPPGDEWFFMPREVMLDYEEQRASLTMLLTEKPAKQAAAKRVKKADKEKAEMLQAILDNPGEGQRGLGRKLDIAQSTVSSRVIKLRDAGLIQPDSMALTDAGMAFIAAYGPTHDEDDEDDSCSENSA